MPEADIRARQFAVDRAARVGGSARMVDFDALRAAVPVTAVLARHGIAHRHGRCACPFCGSDNPTTLSTYADARRWRCWACGAHGDALDAEMRLTGCDLRAAAATLARLAGLPSTPTAAPVDPHRLARRRDRERTLRHWAALRCLSGIDTARMWDAVAYRLHCTGALEIAATGARSEGTLDALGRIYGARDRAERDVDFYATGDLKALADNYFEAQP